jgi:hypothetical protein
MPWEYTFSYWMIGSKQRIYALVTDRIWCIFNNAGSFALYIIKNETEILVSMPDSLLVSLQVQRVVSVWLLFFSHVRKVSCLDLNSGSGYLQVFCGVFSFLRQVPVRYFKNRTQLFHSTPCPIQIDCTMRCAQYIICTINKLYVINKEATSLFTLEVRNDVNLRMYSTYLRHS